MTEYIGLLGITFSALLASIAYFYKSKQDKLKVLRGTLYLFLELRFRILQSTLNPLQASESFFKKVDDILDKLAVEVETDKGDELNEIKKMVTNHFAKLISVSSLKVDDNLVKEINEALNQLSKYEPRLAYILQGQHTIDSIMSQTYAYSSSLIKTVPGCNEAEPFLENATSRAEKLAVSHLDEQIMLLAFKTSFIDWFKTKYLLRKTLTMENRYDFDKLEEQLSMLFQSMVENKSNVDS